MSWTGRWQGLLHLQVRVAAQAQVVNTEWDMPQNLPAALAGEWAPCPWALCNSSGDAPGVRGKSDTNLDLTAVFTHMYTRLRDDRII